MAIDTATARTRPGRPPATQGLGGGFALLFVVVVFLVIAAVVYVNNGDPELRRVDSVAQQYADAWVGGSLDGVEYDTLSGPDVGRGDAGRIAERVRTITHDLDGRGRLRPTRVEVDRSATHLQASDRNLAQTRLHVTWDLARTGLGQQGHVWTYDVVLRIRQDEGRWRVVWTPDAVHPAIRQGLVLRVSRSLAPRAPVIGAGDTALPPAGSPGLARALLGAIAYDASKQQAATDPLNAQPGDTTGVAGLQEIYNERLAGRARIVVTAAPAQDVRGVTPLQQPLFVGVPETPTPIQLTLDARTQGWAEAALRGIPGAATLVVARPSSGDVLAVANSSSDRDYGLSAQAPPGSLFGLTSYLAMIRQGFSATSAVDCREPFTYPGEGQMFRNDQGPRINQVRLGAAIEGGCTTALARLAPTVPPVDLQQAAWDLGIATPLREHGGDAPWVAVADRLGAPAYLGRVTSDSATDLGAPGDEDGGRAVTGVHHAQNMVGEGTVLVSPLSVTRATATVATGRRQALRLVTNPEPTRPDDEKALDPDSTRMLQDVMAKAVTEQGGSAHSLAVLPGSTVHAMAATGGYGTGPATTRAAWVTGYKGDYAFTVLLPDAPAADGTRNALEVARRFLLNVP